MRRNQHSATSVPAPPPAQPPIDLSVVLVTGGYDHEIRFWEAWSGICSRTIARTGESGQVNRIAISPDKRFIAAAIHKKIAVYDITSSANTPVNVCEGHTQNVTAISYHADGKWFVTGSEDGTIRIWDMRSNQSHRTYDNQCPVNDVLIHPNQGELISADQNGNIKQWVLSTNECDLELAPEADVPMRSITMAHDGSFLVAANHEGNCFVWRMTDDTDPQARFKAVHKFKAHNNYLTRCVLSPDSHLLATCSADTTIKIWQVENNYTITHKKTLLGHQRWVWDAAFSADSAYLVSASSDHVARLWDLEKAETLRQYNGHHKAVVCIALNDRTLDYAE
ncbi:hypothetical protein M408DRAFT_305544 [Serendipita vermifera MAFF 305830]|uniref:Protein LST8 homolog n=1 Tax=Serendipita vermifera MAFF 305830 TaxID=933852 RepID=A0A0C3AYH4_SERVB|nr:hypothetical protein M408DRAFT_305544 [Serendipita vermifera MAFF 305830]